jgi:hypothetical protein
MIEILNYFPEAPENLKEFAKSINHELVLASFEEKESLMYLVLTDAQQKERIAQAKKLKIAL